MVYMWGGPRQERNLINVPNSEGSTNLYAPKFDPEDTTGRMLILPVSFLYPTPDGIFQFVEDTIFGAHGSGYVPAGRARVFAAAMVLIHTWMTGPLSSMKCRGERAVKSGVDMTVWDASHAARMSGAQADYNNHGMVL
jgi:hypothetical protein